MAAEGAMPEGWGGVNLGDAGCGVPDPWFDRLTMRSQRGLAWVLG
jgi:hypothetical protein